MPVSGSACARVCTTRSIWSCTSLRMFLLLAFPLDAFACRSQARDAKGRGKHRRVVLVAPGELRFLQPRDRSAHPVVIGRAVPGEFAVVVFEQDLSRRCDDRILCVAVVAAAAIIEPAKRAQDRLDIAPFQPRARGERELLFGILGLEQQQAVRECAVPARPPGFLEVAFERARDLGMHDRADVGLVDAHAERVGGDHHVDVALVESRAGSRAFVPAKGRSESAGLRAAGRRALGPSPRCSSWLCSRQWRRPSPLSRERPRPPDGCVRSVAKPKSA